MSDTHATAIATQQAAPPQPSRHALQRATASKPHRVTGKLAVALKRIVELGEQMDEAAKAAELTTRQVRLALEKPHVIQWMKAQREVFRAYICAQNISALAELRDKSGNAMAQLGAIKVLEQIGDDQQPGAAAPQRAGMVIVVVRESASAEAKPLIDLTPLPPSEG